MQNKIIIKPFQFITLLECEIIREVNQHIKAKVSGYIQDTIDGVLDRDLENEIISIVEEQEGKEPQNLFYGILEAITVEQEGELRKVSFEAISYTSLLDQTRQVRVFQNKDQTYKDVVSFICRENKRTRTLFTENEKKKTEGLLVQYQETDWEFINRIASYLNTVIVADCSNDYSCFYFGLPKRVDMISLSASSYHVKQNIDELEKKRSLGMTSITKRDVTDYYVNSREYLELCEPVEFQGKRFRVMRAFSKWEKGEMTHEYLLRTEQGFKTAPYYNSLIAGVSMRGEIKKVKEERVKVWIEGTKKGMDEDPRWFDFATVYSSKESAGWYCMPEKGDQVRIYFPDEYEKHAFVISAVHIGEQRGWKLNPEEKFIRTVDDKEILLTPEQIKVTNHKGMSITIDDEKGVSIRSNKDIQIYSGESVNLNSQEGITIEGGGGVFLKQNQNMIMIRDGILEKGNKVEHR